MRDHTNIAAGTWSAPKLVPLTSQASIEGGEYKDSYEGAGVFFTYRIS